MALHVVVMAAGKGTRMKSQRPKVLHRLAGRALLQHVLDAARGLQAAQTLVITGHGAEAVELDYPTERDQLCRTQRRRLQRRQFRGMRHP